MENKLEQRLIDFGISISKLPHEIPKSIANNHLLKQLIRSGTAAPLNYAESRAAESKRDFVHKLSISLKELRETEINLKILNGINQEDIIGIIMQENKELISIISKAIITTKRNNPELFPMRK